MGLLWHRVGVRCLVVVALVAAGFGTQALLAGAAPAHIARPAADSDLDGVDDSTDNCVGTYNPDQRDRDGDGIGNRCDPSPFGQDYSEVVFYPRDQTGHAMSAAPCFHYEWSANANSTPQSGDFCEGTSLWWWYQQSPTVPDQTYTVTVTQTSVPSGCSGGLTQPYTFTFGPGRYLATDLRYTCGPPPVATIEVPGGVEPPPQPPPAVAPLTVNVTNNGSVVTVGSSAARQESDIGQPIRCGLKGTKCESDAAPGSTIKMKAQPGSGYQFGGWTGACSGSSPLCTLTAHAASTVSATFVPARAAARRVSAKLAGVRIKARFVQSIGQGTLQARGAVSAPASLRLQLRRPGGGPLVTRRLRVPGGPFAVRATLKKGTLAGGAVLLPGGFVLALTGKARGASVPLQMRTVYVQSPREGVVRRTHISATSAGPAVATLPAGSKEAWAVFDFASQPTTGPLAASWYQPSGALLGTVTKSNRPTIETGIGSGTGLVSGKWRVVLTAGGRVVKQLNVRVR